LEQFIANMPLLKATSASVSFTGLLRRYINAVLLKDARVLRNGVTCNSWLIRCLLEGGGKQSWSQIHNLIKRDIGGQYLKSLHGLGVGTGLDLARQQQLGSGRRHLFGRRDQLLLARLALHHCVGRVAQAVSGYCDQTSLPRPHRHTFTHRYPAALPGSGAEGGHKTTGNIFVTY